MAGRKLTSPSASFSYRNLAGGLNSTASPIELKDNESPDCLNVDFEKYGSVKKRKGTSLLNTTAFNSGAAWNSIYWYEKSDGTQKLIGTCGNKLGKMDDLDGTWDDITGALTITAGQNNFTRWTTFLDVAYGTNGVDVPFEWSGTGNGAAMTVPSTLTTAKYIATFFNRLILAHVTVGGTLHASRLYWSNIDAETWDSAAFRNVNTNDNQVITGIRPLGRSLVIFKSRSIWIATYTGDPDIPFLFEDTHSPVGCISGGSIADADNGLIFESVDGTYFFDGNNSFKMSFPVQVTRSGFNTSRFQYTQSVYDNSRNLYLASYTASGGTENSRQLTYDTFLGAWSTYDGIAANCWARVFVSGLEKIYFGDYDGYVHLLNDTTRNSDESTSASFIGAIYDASIWDDPDSIYAEEVNDDTAINAYYYTKWFDYEDLISKKSVPQLNIYYQYSSGSDLTFAYSYNFETSDQYIQSFSMSLGNAAYGTSRYGLAVYDSVGGSVERRSLTGRGYVIRFKFANMEVDQTFVIDGFGAYPYVDTDR